MLDLRSNILSKTMIFAIYFFFRWTYMAAPMKPMKNPETWAAKDRKFSAKLDLITPSTIRKGNTHPTIISAIPIRKSWTGRKCIIGTASKPPDDPPPVGIPAAPLRHMSL